MVAAAAAVEAVEAAAGSDTKLGSLVNICPTGNSDCKSFLATDFYFSTFLVSACTSWDSVKGFLVQI